MSNGKEGEVQKEDKNDKTSAVGKRLKKMEIVYDQEEFVVIDIGSGYIKAGFSGEDRPRVIIPTVMSEKTMEIDQSLATGILE
jgi:actin-related protein